MEPRFLTAGEKCLTVCFGEEISLRLNSCVKELNRVLSKDPIDGVLETVPTYVSLSVHFDPAVIRRKELYEALKERIKMMHPTTDEQAPVKEIPVYYGGETGPDLEECARLEGISVRELIRRHSSHEYYVFQLGFSPGHPYMARFEEPFSFGRRETPRVDIPARSVVVQKNLTNITPFHQACGWNIIGSTPIDITDFNRKEPFFFSAGDRVKIRPVDKDEYDRLRKTADEIADCDRLRKQAEEKASERASVKAAANVTEKTSENAAATTTAKATEKATATTDAKSVENAAAMSAAKAAEKATATTDAKSVENAAAMSAAKATENAAAMSAAKATENTAATSAKKVGITSIKRFLTKKRLTNNLPVITISATAMPSAAIPAEVTGFTVLAPGALTTIQDEGRFHYQAGGISPAGPMDHRAFHLANIIAGNPRGEAALEITMTGPLIRFEKDSVIAITGADISPCINGKPAAMYRPLSIFKDDTLSFGKRKSGCRAYVAFAGGIREQKVLESCSTDLKNGLGGHEGRALKTGDRIPLADLLPAQKPGTSNFPARERSQSILADSLPTQKPGSSNFPARERSQSILADSLPAQKPGSSNFPAREGSQSILADSLPAQKPAASSFPIQEGSQSGSNDMLPGKALGKVVPVMIIRPENNYPKDEIVVRVVMGPQEDSFTARGIREFFNYSSVITEKSDRQGIRLDRKPIEFVHDCNIISDGISLGAIQVTGDGKPIILLADRQSVGGYAKIGTVIYVDLPKLAQALPGMKVRFVRVSAELAEELYLREMNELNQLEEKYVQDRSEQ